MKKKISIFLSLVFILSAVFLSRATFILSYSKQMPQEIIIKGKNPIQNIIPPEGHRRISGKFRNHAIYINKEHKRRSRSQNFHGILYLFPLHIPHINKIYPKQNHQKSAWIQLPRPSELSPKNINKRPCGAAARTGQPRQDKKRTKRMENRFYHNIINQENCPRPFILSDIPSDTFQDHPHIFLHIHSISLMKKSRPLIIFIFLLPQSGQTPPQTVA